MSDQQKKHHILLIEDDKDIASYIKRSFEARNYVVTHIGNGLQAINTIESLPDNHYSIVLLDIMLPGATGWEILARIRSMSIFNHCPVIMLTGLDDDSSEARALLDGAEDYIVKPCSMKVLSARVEVNLRKSNASLVSNIDLPCNKNDFEQLSDREKEILSYLVKGYSNKKIAELAFISEQTVQNHLRSIFKKTKSESRLQVAIAALKYGLI
jgi:DNA-binding NarL/FixJ family response regulator